MATYPINKGVGKSVEVKGLRAQYVIYAVAGTVLSFVVFFIVSLMFGQVAAVIAAVLFMAASLGSAFYFNSKFGETGLIKYFARKSTPEHLSNTKRIYKLIQVKSENKI